MSFDAPSNAPDLNRLSPIEATEICNRIADSEDFTAWGNAGITLTTGQADSLGTTRATKLTRTGAKWVLGDGAGGPGVYPGWSISDGELITHGIDLTGTPVNGALWIEAKAGTSFQLLAFVYDGTYGVVFPSKVLTLDTDWKWYRFPFSYNPTRGALSLCLSPGGFDPEKGSCYIRAVQIDDGRSNSYKKTAGAVVLPDNTAATVLERGTILDSLTASAAVVTDAAKKLASLAYTTAAAASSLLKLDSASRAALKGIISSGSVPTISNVSATIGTGGTVTLDTGSNDLAGTIIINTGTGSPSYYVTFRLTWSTTLPGNDPIVQLTLADAGSAWGSGNSVFLGGAHVIADGDPNSQISIFANNVYGSAGAVTTLNFAASSTYKIHYHVINK